MRRPIKIEKGIPIPALCRGGGRPPGARDRVPWAKLTPGDSVLVRAAKARVPVLQMQLATNARRVADRLGVEFTTRQVAGGVRVWRIR